MGARGPKPTPSAVKAARGTYRPDRAAANEAAPVGKPSCPKWVTDPDAKREFRRLVKLLSEMGLIGAADQNLLIRYVLAWVRYRRVVQTLATNAAGEFAVYKDEKGTVKSVQVSALQHRRTVAVGGAWPGRSRAGDDALCPLSHRRRSHGPGVTARR